MIGQRFGRLTVVEEAPRYIAPKTGKPRRRWLCRCECGGETVTVARKLVSGYTKSCGCISAERRLKHGHQIGGKSLTYQVWDAMIQRCYNKKHSKFYMYGARGIKVCDQWLSFGSFLADMGERPSKSHSIDRHPDGLGNYGPGNCRWATRKEQQRNIRSNHMVEYRGRTMSLAEAAELAGVEKNKLYPLVNHRGMSIDEAIRHVGG